MSSGFLRIQSFTSRLAAPLGYVDITVEGPGFNHSFTTDSSGQAADIEITAPDKRLSLVQGETTRPYAVCSISASKGGWQGLRLEGVQVFDGQVTLAQLEMLPSRSDLVEEVVIPEHPLYSGDGGSGPAPENQDDGTGPAILDRVIIPEKITVHLGRPAASAQNVTVSFREYIANVASSEVYPTWPENALRANIHAQISLALNRVYTEWYRSRGYNYDITNSTSYDQYFVYKRTIFEVMQRLTDEIFNTYVQKGTGSEPYYTEYCDGRTVSCPGMKQWGTVTLANQGYTPLQILRYYYGSSVSIRTSRNITAIPESYPGQSLRRGDNGTAVSVLQRQLNRIARDYPFFGTLEVDGVFGAQMETVVKRFQKQFNLAQDGVVGRSTWYKISYIYASVKRLAQLTSEGDENNTLSGGAWGGETLRQGSTGTAVERAQFWLNTLAQFDPGIPSVAVDGVFGTGTAAAVRAFQQQYGLVADGLIGRTTWEALYGAYQSAQDDINNNLYPGSPLRLGSEGANVKQIQFWLRIIARNYIALEGVVVDGHFGTATRQAVMSFQDYFGLTADGVVGEQTWNKLYTLYLNTINGLLAPNQRPGVFPGTLRRGSTGTAVRELQYYLYILASYYPTLGSVSIDGSFGSRTEESVQVWQALNSLAVDGVVGQRTWNSIASRAAALRVASPNKLVGSVPWPGETLEVGCTGEAVEYVTRLLELVAFWEPEVQSFGISSDYTSQIEESVRSFQQATGLDVTGTVNRITWDTLEMTASQLLAQKEG